jgi:ketosteroid isomerase-like protein
MPQQSRPTEASAHEFVSAPGRKNSALVIPVTIAATVLVLALGGISAWLLFGTKRNEAAGNVRPGVDRTSASPATTGSPAVSPPAATRTPAASPSPVDTAAVRNEVTALLNGWADSSTERDIDAHMSYYADTLDVYYNKRNVGASTVRADRRRAYDTYQTLDISLSNIRITPDATTGERATAVFDKTWSFEGEEKVTSGSVQQELRLAKIDGRWRITGERDLQVYYVNR